MVQKFIGVDLGTHHIKVVVVSASFRSVFVVDAFTEPVGAPPQPPLRTTARAGEAEAPARGAGESEPEPPVDPFEHQLRTLFSALRARGLLGLPTAVCLPSGDVGYRLLSFPFTDERRIAQAVGFEAEGQFPQPFEELVSGHVAVPGGARSVGRALVAAAPKERVNTVHAVFRRTASELKAVTTSGIAVATVADLGLRAPAQGAEQGRQPCGLVVDLGHKHTQFVAVGAKGPLAIRSTRRGGRQLTAAIARAFSLDFADAEAAKHAHGCLPSPGASGLTEDQMRVGAVVAQAFEPILRELEHTRMWLRASYSLEVSTVALVGGGARLLGAGEFVAEQTGLPVAPFRAVAPGLKVDPHQMARAAEIAGALGAAYSAARRPLLRLRDDVAPEFEGGWVQEKMAGLAGLGVAVMAFGALDTVARVNAADAELAVYEDELARATEDAFGTAVAVSQVAATLDAAEGADLTSLVPERGALETLAMIVEAATPADLAAPASGNEAPAALHTGPQSTDPSTIESKAPGPISPGSGIVLLDNLVLEMVDIRELKVELKANANTSSAQDRLAAQLTALGCIDNVSKGKVRGDARKTFQMDMDNKCYFQRPSGLDDEGSDGEEG